MVKVGDYVALKGKGWGTRQGEIVRVSQVCPLVYTAEGYYPDIYVEGIPGEILGPYPNEGTPPSFSYEPIGQSLHSSGTPASTVTKPTFSLVPEGTDEPLKLSKDDIDAIAEVVIQKLKARL